jgi:hypothetical protein
MALRRQASLEIVERLFVESQRAGLTAWTEPAWETGEGRDPELAVDCHLFFFDWGMCSVGLM